MAELSPATVTSGRKNPVMNSTEARQWLDEEWTAAMAANDMEPDSAIDVLANSNGVAVRYALVTQLLGKIADPMRDLCAVQLAAGGVGAWDARSFSTSVVVPWVSANQHVLGTSAVFPMRQWAATFRQGNR